jgi:hypothetical protein
MARRPSFCISRERILPGYLLALVAATAAVDYLPFSIVRLSLLAVMLGIFYVIVLPVLVMAYLRAGLAVSRALLSLGRRLFLGDVHKAAWRRRIRPLPSKNDKEPHGNDDVLWDWWIDGAR